MKIIFIDIDGVLNTFQEIRNHGFDYIDPVKVHLLSTIVSATGAELILSSMWRLKFEDRCLVTAAFDEYGMKLADMTGKNQFSRGNEIQDWLNENKHKKQIEDFVILDDDDDVAESVNLRQHWFQTYGDTGLTPEIAADVISFLNKTGEFND